MLRARQPAGCLPEGRHVWPRHSLNVLFFLPAAAGLSTLQFPAVGAKPAFAQAAGLHSEAFTGPSGSGGLSIRIPRSGGSSARSPEASEALL